VELTPAGRVQELPSCFPRVGGPFGASATSHAEQALREYEVDHNGEVDKEDHDFEDAQLRREFVYLQGEQDRGCKKCEVFRPALSEPEPDHLRRLKSRVRQRHHTELIKVCRVVQEELVESSKEPSERSGSAGRTEKRIHDAVVIALQSVAMTDEHEQNDCNPDEQKDVDSAIDGDQAEYVTIPKQCATKG